MILQCAVHNNPNVEPLVFCGYNINLEIRSIAPGWGNFYWTGIRFYQTNLQVGETFRRNIFIVINLGPLRKPKWLNTCFAKHTIGSTVQTVLYLSCCISSMAKCNFYASYDIYSSCCSEIVLCCHTVSGAESRMASDIHNTNAMAIFPMVPRRHCEYDTDIMVCFLDLTEGLSHFTTENTIGKARNKYGISWD